MKETKHRFADEMIEAINRGFMAVEQVLNSILRGDDEFKDENLKKYKNLGD